MSERTHDFPPEVYALKAQGIPLPSWYCGPLVPMPDPDRDRAAIAALVKVREDAA